MVIVLIATVAATIAVVAVQLGMFRVTNEIRLTSVETATNNMNSVRGKVQAALEQDPLGIYAYVLPEELPRICPVNGNVIAPGAAWPSTCGTSWTYDSAPNEATSGVKITPPGPDDPRLTVDTFARLGNISVGTTDTYAVGSKMRPRLYAGGTLNLNLLGARTITGPVYAYDDIGVNGTSADPGSVIASEQSISGSLVGADNGGNFAAQAAEAGPPVVYEIRKVYPQPMPPSLLRSSLSGLANLGCGPEAPFAVGQKVSELCIEPGGVLRDAVGSLVNIPSDIESALILPGTTGTLTIYTSSSDPSTMPGTSCAAGCDLTSLATDATNPGNGSYWGTPLGEFNLPTSGVIGTKVHAFLGLCGPGFATGAACANRGASGSTAYSETFTVSVGTLDKPKDAYLAGPISAAQARVGVVASGRVIVPYFAISTGNSLALDIDIAAVGEGTQGTPLVSMPSTSTSAASRRGTLQVGGLLLLGQSGAATGAYSDRSIVLLEDSSNAPPWFPSPSLNLAKRTSTPMTPEAAGAAFAGT